MRLCNDGFLTALDGLSLQREGYPYLFLFGCPTKRKGRQESTCLFHGHWTFYWHTVDPTFPYWLNGISVLYATPIIILYSIFLKKKTTKKKAKSIVACYLFVQLCWASQWLGILGGGLPQKSVTERLIYGKTVPSLKMGDTRTVALKL